MNVRSRVSTALEIANGIVFGGLGEKAPVGTMTVTPGGSGQVVSDGWGAYLDNVRPEQLRMLYRLSTWVHAAVSVIAEAQMEAEFAVFPLQTDEGQQTREPIMGHPFVNLMNEPNPWMSGAEMHLRRAADLELAGNAYWMLFPVAGTLGAMMPVPPHMVRPISDPNRFISAYEVQGSTQSYRVAPEFICHFRRYDPERLTLGMPTTRAIFTPALGDLKAAQYGTRFAAQGMRPEVAFTTSEEMDPEEARELKQDLVDAYGGPEHAGDPMVLWSGLTPVKLAFTPREAELVTGRSFSRDEILAGFKLSKAHIGITEGMSRANAEAMLYQLGVVVIRPKLRLAQATITSSILRPYYGAVTGEFLNVVPADEDRILRKAMQLRVGRAITKNELRKLLFPGRLGEMEGGDEIATGAPAGGRAGGGGADSGDGPGAVAGTTPATGPAEPGAKDVATVTAALMAQGATLEEIDVMLDGGRAMEEGLADFFRRQSPAIVAEVVDQLKR